MNDEKCSKHQCWVSWWICGVAPSCWKIQSISKTLFPYFRATESTFLIYRAWTTVPSSEMTNGETPFEHARSCTSWPFVETFSFRQFRLFRLLQNELEPIVYRHGGCRLRQCRNFSRRRKEFSRFVLFENWYTDPIYECFSLSFMSAREERLNSLLVRTILKIFLRNSVDACLGDTQFSGQFLNWNCSISICPSFDLLNCSTRSNDAWTTWWVCKANWVDGVYHLASSFDSFQQYSLLAKTQNILISPSPLRYFERTTLCGSLLFIPKNIYFSYIVESRWARNA